MWNQRFVNDTIPDLFASKRKIYITKKREKNHNVLSEELNHLFKQFILIKTSSNISYPVLNRRMKKKMTIKKLVFMILFRKII